MANIIRYSFDFTKGIGGAILLAWQAIGDPLLPFLRWSGIVKPDFQWPLSDGGMQTMFAAVALIWLFVWYFRVRSRYDASQENYTMPLHIACRWIARDSNWAATYKWPDDQWPQKVHNEILAKWVAGKFEFAGVEPNSGNYHIKLPPAMRDGGKFDAHQLCFEQPPTKIWNTDMRVFDYILLDERDVKRIWPKRGILARIGRMSPIERIGASEPKFRQQDQYYCAQTNHLPAEIKV